MIDVKSAIQSITDKWFLSEPLPLSIGILILGNCGVKNSRTYEEDDSLRGYVLNLQKFEELLKEGQKNGERNN